MEKSYCVAGHSFTVEADSSVFKIMQQYEPFAIDNPSEVLFKLTISSEDKPFKNYREDYRQIEDLQTNLYGRIEDGRYIFGFLLNDQETGWLVSPKDFKEGILYATGLQFRFAINMSLKIMYAFSTAPLNTVMIHASTVSHDGKGFMFIGKSGAGKSTHSRQWIEYIEGTELINDDNPIIRVGDNGGFYVYGSPWSGKTPCYRNVKYPLKGIVRIVQAPDNHIFQLHGLDAFVMLRGNITNLNWIKSIADGLFHTETIMAEKIPVWVLECLPNGDAAKLCQSTIEQK